VYDAYLQYLRHPGSLIVSDDPPPKGAAHMCKKYCGRYFWVPTEYRGLFFTLALQTTAQRGKPVVTPDEFFNVSLTRILSEEPSAVQGASVVTVELDKAIPSGMGHLILNNDNTNQQLQLQSVEGNLIAFGIQDTLKEKLLRALPQAGRVYLLNQRPAPPTTEDLINRINFQLQQIQFNQLRVPTGL
jgi:hypothetical protein